MCAAVVMLNHTGRRPIIRRMPGRRDSTPSERRSNLELRAVIDEMLERIRDYRRLTGAWTPDERAQAEHELELIMARIRETATRKDGRGTD